MNKKGVTVIELLIYIALFAIISMLIGKLFKTLTNNYFAAKRISRQQTEARDIIGLMAREIRNTGVKVYFRLSGSNYVKDTASGTWVSASDLSSFTHTESATGSYGDQLTIYFARLKSDGDSAGVDTVRYYLNGTNLMRDLKTGALSQSLVAENVHALQFSYGVYGSNTLLFKDSLTNTANWTLVNESGTAPTKSSSGTLNLTFTAAATGYVRYTTQKAVAKNRKYTIQLRINQSGGFPENLESMSFDFFTTQLCGSENFKPYSGDKWITLTASLSGNAEMRLRYYTKGAGVLDIKVVKAVCSADSIYTWTCNPTAAEKQYVRAIRIYVLTRTSQKAGTVANTPIQVGNVTVPRSGEYTWRLYEEVIKIPNNGNF